MGIKVPPTEAEIQVAAERKRKLDRLTEYPEWAELQALAAEDKERAEKRLFRSFTRGRAPAVDQRLIDRHIGFWEGVEAVLASPERFAKKAERMLDTALSAQQEGDTSE